MASPIPIPFTLLYGGANAFLTALLGFNVSRMRGRDKVFLGDAPSADMTRAIRAHGNNAEWVPLAIVLLLLLELSGVSPTLLHAFGGGLLFARVAHAHGALAKAPNTVVGALLTYLITFGMAGYAIYLHFIQ
jgi:uncharacterized membrane protein YecN with MAPEG domain